MRLSKRSLYRPEQTGEKIVDEIHAYWINRVSNTRKLASVFASIEIEIKEFLFLFLFTG